MTALHNKIPLKKNIHTQHLQHLATMVDTIKEAKAHFDLLNFYTTLLNIQNI